MSVHSTAAGMKPGLKGAQRKSLVSPMKVTTVAPDPVVEEERRSSMTMKTTSEQPETPVKASPPPRPQGTRRKSRITMVMERDELDDDTCNEDKVLADMIDEKQLETMNEMFLNAPKQRMDQDQFRRLLESVLNVYYDESVFEVTFLKIDAKRDGFIDWAELVSYLMLEFQDKYIDKIQVCFDNPIGGIPRIYKTHHHFYPIVRITFYPDVLADRSINYLHGNYLTCSTNGTLNYWSLDMEQIRNVTSKSPYLKVTPSWVTDMMCLPDVRIVCTSSTERELRFYDTSAKQFELRVVISSLEHAVVCMYYHFNKNIEEDSRLICGDTGGNIRIFSFNTYHKGPFYHKPGIDVRHVLYERVLKGELPHMKVLEFKDVHQDWVKQVGYNAKLNSFVSCAVCPDNSVYMRDALGTTTQYVYRVIAGVTCFCIEESAHLIVTGSPDCIVRLWSTFVPQKATCIFQGHHASIVAVIIQKEGRQIISISKDRCVKVWDVAFQNCIQTYMDIPASLGEHSAMSVFYNPLNHSIFVGCMQIAVFICEALVSEDTTDGTSHLNPVAVALYNPLFKVIVSVGSGSMIMVWNPWKGKRNLLTKHAHTVMLYGQLRPVEITAATFDPCWQLLLTGAYDGSLKIWNFLTGTCLRNMMTDGGCEVSSVVWVKNRILAVGWNRHVIEWEDTEKLSKGKSWETRHSSDVLCAAYRYPQCLATSSYNGELVLWRLETGTAYKKYQVTNPTNVCSIEYIKKDSFLPQGQDGSLPKGSSISSRATSTIVGAGTSKAPRAAALRSSQRKRYSSTSTTMRMLSVHAMIFLCSRPMQADTGTLLVALENGQIQMWSHHGARGFITSFHAIHVAGDYITAMETDLDNKYLFTGTTMGYTKIWLMQNYCVPYPVRLVMPRLRLQFPFLWADRIQGRAKRAVRHQPLPLLLSSYRAHLASINTITYMAGSKILVTASADYTVRMWTLGGRYIGTLGTYHPWVYITPGQEPKEDYPYRIPPDIKRVGSFTTLRVLQGGMKTWEPRKNHGMIEVKQEFSDDVMKKCVYGKPLSAPFLGKHFSLPSRPSPSPHLPVLDRSMPRIPVFCHLSLHDEGDIPRPVTPELIRERRHHENTLADTSKSQSKTGLPGSKPHSPPKSPPKTGLASKPQSGTKTPSKTKKK